MWVAACSVDFLEDDRLFFLLDDKGVKTPQVLIFLDAIIAPFKLKPGLKVDTFPIRLEPVFKNPASVLQGVPYRFWQLLYGVPVWDVHVQDIAVVYVIRHLHRIMPFRVLKRI